MKIKFETLPVELETRNSKLGVSSPAPDRACIHPTGDTGKCAWQRASFP